MWKLLMEYGFAALFGAMRMLIRENEELRMRIYQLEQDVSEPVVEFKKSPLEPYKEELLDVDWTESDEEIAKNIQIKTAHRRNTNDLYREAKQKYEEQLAAQEKMVDEAVTVAEENLKPVEVRISEQKSDFYINEARAIMNGSKN